MMETDHKIKEIKLGVNIDHIATLRNARGEKDPSLIDMALEAQEGGAASLTMHLREDRRHIVDDDLFDINKHLKIPINMEMALTQEMIDIALKLKPKSVCIVPEKREELTTEGGLNTTELYDLLSESLPVFKEVDIEVFLFTEATQTAVEHAAKLGVRGIEAHTGNFARSFFHNKAHEDELKKIHYAGKLCKEKHLEFHAGHGLNYHNIYSLLHIENLSEVNIGHAIISKALKVGMRQAVHEMKNILLRMVNT
ncbi:MAG: pyridoxine 5'-phosphate synthase [Leptospirales bacterium]